ncbi:MAG TPA: kelch repeat-containing protein [Sphingobacterium sp.]|nr:kelch repeat-containing protein [Sphingobacterium sp.]
MNKKNLLLFFLACSVALASFNSCKKSDDKDSNTDTGPTEWTRASAFDGDPRNGAASFQIEDKGYLVSGILKTNERVKDAWQFDISSGEWSNLAEFIGSARHGAVGFAIDGKGFVGSGFDGETALTDFYKYDPSSNSWSQIADFPGEGRHGAVAFALDGYGYVGLGANEKDKTFKDFYKYDPTNDTWTQISTTFKYKRKNAFAFVIGDKAYVGGGIDNNQYPEDFYSFDGDEWKPLRDLKIDDSNSTYDVTRQAASTFVIGNNAFLVGGKKGNVINTVWKYDPSADRWSGDSQAFLGSAREDAVSFSSDSKGYITTGANGSNKFDDTWEFKPVR